MFVRIIEHIVHMFAEPHKTNCKIAVSSERSYTVLR